MTCYLSSSLVQLSLPRPPSMECCRRLLSCPGPSWPKAGAALMLQRLSQRPRQVCGRLGFTPKSCPSNDSHGPLPSPRP